MSSASGDESWCWRSRRRGRRANQLCRRSNTMSGDSGQCVSSRKSLTTSFGPPVCESIPAIQGVLVTSRLHEVTSHENIETRSSNVSSISISSKITNETSHFPRLAAVGRSRWRCHLWAACALTIVALVAPVSGNVPPRFLLDGQSEIVLRLREGDQTPVGEYREEQNFRTLS